MLKKTFFFFFLSINIINKFLVQRPAHSSWNNQGPDFSGPLSTKKLHWFCRTCLGRGGEWKIACTRITKLPLSVAVMGIIIISVAIDIINAIIIVVTIIVNIIVL